jgi:hypothetical protein
MAEKLPKKVQGILLSLILSWDREGGWEQRWR